MFKILLHLMLSTFIIRSFAIASSPDQGCTCAIMNGDSLDAPIMEQKFDISIGCDEDGSMACRNLCVSLAEAAKTSGNGSLMLCEHMDEDVEIYVTVYSKVCDEPYSHTGLAYSNHLCCKDRKPDVCADE